MVAAVAVGDLLAHAVVCGVEFGFLVLADGYGCVRADAGLGELCSGGEGDIYSGSFRDIW